MTDKQFIVKFTKILGELRSNDENLIQKLTSLASNQNENLILEIVCRELDKRPATNRLPIYYLIGSLLRIGLQYVEALGKFLASSFHCTYREVEGDAKNELFYLRQSWTNLLPDKKLYTLDVQTHLVDPKWPITAPLPKFHCQDFHKRKRSKFARYMYNKQRQLLELEQKKLELEVKYARFFEKGDVTIGELIEQDDDCFDDLEDDDDESKTEEENDLMIQRLFDKLLNYNYILNK